MYNTLSRDGDTEYGINEYVCDEEADLYLLPNCKMGSQALVLENSSVYIKDGNGVWKLLV